MRKAEDEQHSTVSNGFDRHANHAPELGEGTQD
jgi:hypothetical protein